jgi:hypothetical protein
MAQKFMRNLWTHDQMDRLEKLLRDGLTYTQIGERLGKSKNSITGKVFRLNYSTSPIKLIDLRASQCRWPIGDPKSPMFGFCGCKISPGARYKYCVTHMDMATQKKR